MPQFEKDENELGVLWQKESAKGTYFSGMLGDQAIVVFKNTRKAPGSKAPDWRILKGKPKPIPSDDISF